MNGGYYYFSSVYSGEIEVGYLRGIRGYSNIKSICKKLAQLQFKKK